MSENQTYNKLYNKKIINKNYTKQIQYFNKIFYQIIGAHYANQCYQFKCFITPNNEDNQGKRISFPVSKFHPVRKNTPSTGDVLMNVINDNLDCNIFFSTGFYNFNKNGNESIRDVRCIMFDIDDIPEINKENISNNDILQIVLNKYPFLEKMKPHAIIASGNKGAHLIYTFSNNLMFRKKDMSQLLSILGELLNADKGHLSLGAQIRLPFSFNNETENKIKCFYNKKYEIVDSSVFFDIVNNALSDYIILENADFGFKFELKQDFEDKYCDYDNEDNVIYPDEESCERTGTYWYDFKQYCEKCIGHTISADNAKYHGELGFNKLHTNTNKKEQKSNHCSSIYDVKKNSVLGKCMIDLRRYFENNNGDLCGHRNNYLYNVAVILTLANIDQKSLYKQLLDINSKFKKPLSLSEVRCLAECNFTHRYKLNLKKVADMLDFDEDFMKHSLCAYTPEIRESRIKKYREKEAEKRRQKTARKLRTKINKMKKLLEKDRNVSLKKLMEVTEWSINTVKKYRKIIIQMIEKEVHTRLLTLLKDSLATDKNKKCTEEESLSLLAVNAV